MNVRVLVSPSEGGPSQILKSFGRRHHVPVELQLGSLPDRNRGLSTSAADIERKALSEARIVRQEIQPLALHGATGAARHAPHFEFQDDAEPGARSVAGPRRIRRSHQPRLYPTAAVADGFLSAGRA